MPLEKARLFQNVVMKLSVLRYMVKARSKLCRTDLNRDCETFFAEVLNRAYGYQLVNLNDTDPNAAAIDLADDEARLGVQVTATSTSPKIKQTIEKFLAHKLYSTYDTLVVLILGDKKNYRAKFETAGKFKFEVGKHIWDIDDVLEKIETLGLEDLRGLSDYIDGQLPQICKALDPESLLAQAEENLARPAASATSLLRESEIEPGSKDWGCEFSGIQKLFSELCALSKKQREFIAFIMIQGKPTGFNGRCMMGIQTIEQKLRLSRSEMRQYYDALHQAGLVELDNDDAARNIELSFGLESGADAFALLQAYLKTEERIRSTIVNCDFTLLD
jgi:hypothetical protein